MKTNIRQTVRKLIKEEMLNEGSSGSPVSELKQRIKDMQKVVKTFEMITKKYKGKVDGYIFIPTESYEEGNKITDKIFKEIGSLTNVIDLIDPVVEDQHVRIRYKMAWED